MRVRPSRRSAPVFNQRRSTAQPGAAFCSAALRAKTPCAVEWYIVEHADEGGAFVLRFVVGTLLRAARFCSSTWTSGPQSGVCAAEGIVDPFIENEALDACDNPEVFGEEDLFCCTDLMAEIIDRCLGLRHLSTVERVFL